MFSFTYFLLGLQVVEFATAAVLPTLTTLSQVNYTSTVSYSPPVIPNFSTTVEYDRSNPLAEWELYTLLVQGMSVISRLPWESRVASDPFPIRPPGLPLSLVARHSASMGPNKLQIQHLIMGMYEIGRDMVRQRPFRFFEAYALLFLQHEPIAIVTIEKRPITTPADVGSGLTEEFQNISVNEIPRPAQKGETFAITDYQQPTFRIFGTFTGDEVNIWDVFTTLLSALAQIAVQPHDDKGASISAVTNNVRSRALFGLHDSGKSHGRKLLSYGQASRAIVNLWKMFLEKQKYGGLRFIIDFDGEEIGEGFINGFAVR